MNTNRWIVLSGVIVRSSEGEETIPGVFE